MSKYSSYKEHQLITENWRQFLAEEQAADHSALAKLLKQLKQFPDLVITKDPKDPDKKNQVIRTTTARQSSDVLKAIHNLGGADALGLSVQKNADRTFTVFPTKSAEVDEE